MESLYYHEWKLWSKIGNMSKIGEYIFKRPESEKFVVYTRNRSL
jgi:hypothetical protein